MEHPGGKQQEDIILSVTNFSLKPQRRWKVFITDIQPGAGLEILGGDQTLSEGH